VGQRIRKFVRVSGMVQGVGFRPFVYTLASGFGLGGLVGNDADGVFVEVEGDPDAVAMFMLALRSDAPPLASIAQIATTPLPPDGSTTFAIAPSQARAPGGPRTILVSADTATCDDCLAELADQADRRFGYPFINCATCGPRFTIITGVPYDRAQTTMAGFAMCALCEQEYHDPANRRFHAQATCCAVCGPRLRLTDNTGAEHPVHPIEGAAETLARGGVLAVKGLGGYHLAADASSERATAALRARKHREDKPFAVMAADLEQARMLCVIDVVAAGLLTSRRRPIVLLPRRQDSAVAEAVAPGNRCLGLMLPYTPLHHLLLAKTGPIVLTSGNISDEPIAHTDADALERLGGSAGTADSFLTHDRTIHTRTDDSVIRPFRGKAYHTRRSRGYAPEPVRLGTRFPRPVLACGAELKNTFCLAKGDRAVISQHIGDLMNAETLRSFTESITHISALFDIVPDVVAHDLHPDYLSTKYALDRADSSGEALDLVGVQHHHAHIASCLADNGADRPDQRVIGVAFDGTGYGTDGTIWGGEFLIASLADFDRAGHLAVVPMPGGAAAIRQPWRMAAAYLDACGLGREPDRPDVERRNERQWANVVAIARRGINAPITSSAGRLFDAVAALLGVRDVVNYEGQAAIELEQLADPAETSAYPAAISPGDVLLASGLDLFSGAAADLAAGVSREVIAARFHNGTAGLIVACCRLLRERTGLSMVALSGGVFQNMLLLNKVVADLETCGFAVLTHSQVPCNDGGISLGQAVVAAARTR
jgi:hydrogenase maturation protein HypF